MVGPRKLEGGESASIYMTDDNEDKRMEMVTYNERVDGRKRSRNDRKESSEASEESGEPSKVRKENSSEKELQRMAQAIVLLKKKSQETQSQNNREKEERERRAVKEQKKVRENEIRDTIRVEKAEKIDKIQIYTRKIIEAIEKENAGKTAVRREDQATVRRAVFEIQNEVLDLLKIMIRAEERARVAEDELKRYKENVKAMSGRARLEGEKERRNERSMIAGRSERSMIAGGSGRRGGVDENSSSGDWQEKNVRRRARTYAQAAKGSESEGIDRRVVVPGKEGWKTPPLKSSAGEMPLIVTSREESDARRLADSLAKSVTVRDIEGAPRAIRKIRDDKLVIVPKDGQQKEKMVEALQKVKGVEVRENKRTEPLLVITGVAKGLTDEEIVQQTRLGLSESGGANEIKVVKRQPCRNNWKENVVIKTDIGCFKELVKNGKIDMDCTLCYVEEYLGLAMCYRCCRFGHTSRVCKEAAACHRCEGGHDGRECKTLLKKCTNCIRMYGKSGEHTARDNDCPAMRAILARSRGNISYGR